MSQTTYKYDKEGALFWSSQRKKKQARKKGPPHLMTDKASRAEAMQHHTMASSSQCPPAVLLMTEAKAELNAGLIIVTGHAPTHTGDVDMDQGTPDASMPPAEAAGSDASDARAPKARRIVHPANNKCADEWVTALCNSRANFLATTAVPEDHAEAIRGGLVLTPLLGCKAKTPLDWTHAWAMLGNGRNHCFPHPRARRMATSRRWSVPTSRLYPANPALPHMGPSHLRAGSALPHVGVSCPLPHPLPPRGQTISKQRVKRRVRPSTRSACLPWEQGWPRTEAPTVAKSRAATACRLTHRS